MGNLLTVVARCWSPSGDHKDQPLLGCSGIAADSAQAQPQEGTQPYLSNSRRSSGKLPVERRWVLPGSWVS